MLGFVFVVWISLLVEVTVGTVISGILLLAHVELDNLKSRVLLDLGVHNYIVINLNLHFPWENKRSESSFVLKFINYLSDERIWQFCGVCESVRTYQPAL